MIEFGAIGPPDWEVCFIVGGGPSLRGYDLTHLRRAGKILGINRSAFEVGADALFTLDLKFIAERRRELEAFPGEKYLAVPASYDEESIPGVTYLERRQGRGLSDDPSWVVNGLNSGYGGVHVPYWKGARRVYLLGFDLQNVPINATHWHGGYPWQNGSSTKYYQRWAARFEELDRARGEMQIFNCNPDSAITAFPVVTYEELGLQKRT